MEALILFAVSDTSLQEGFWKGEEEYYFSFSLKEKLLKKDKSGKNKNWDFKLLLSTMISSKLLKLLKNISCGAFVC